MLVPFPATKSCETGELGCPDVWAKDDVDIGLAAFKATLLEEEEEESLGM